MPVAGEAARVRERAARGCRVLGRTQGRGASVAGGPRASPRSPQARWTRRRPGGCRTPFPPHPSSGSCGRAGPGVPPCRGSRTSPCPRAMSGALSKRSDLANDNRCPGLSLGLGAPPDPRTGPGGAPAEELPGAGWAKAGQDQNRNELEPGPGAGAGRSPGAHRESAGALEPGIQARNARNAAGDPRALLIGASEEEEEDEDEEEDEEEEDGAGISPPALGTERGLREPPGRSASRLFGGPGPGSDEDSSWATLSQGSPGSSPDEPGGHPTRGAPVTYVCPMEPHGDLSLSHSCPIEASDNLWLPHKCPTEPDGCPSLLHAAMPLCSYRLHICPSPWLFAHQPPWVPFLVPWAPSPLGTVLCPQSSLVLCPLLCLLVPVEPSWAILTSLGTGGSVELCVGLGLTRLTPRALQSRCGRVVREHMGTCPPGGCGCRTPRAPTTGTSPLEPLSGSPLVGPMRPLLMAAPPPRGPP